MRLHAAAMKPIDVGAGAPKRRRNKATKVGRPGPVNPFFEAARSRTLTAKGMIGASTIVPVERYNRCMAACKACPHSSVMEAGDVFCECVQCSRWRVDRRVQNWFSMAMCPHAPPHFVPYRIPEQYQDLWRAEVPERGVA
jgi:hypothetical protein